MKIEYAYLGGNCPVQAEGTISGMPFYFRARGVRWSLSIGDDPVANPDWEHEEEWGDGPYDAGWMPEDVARQMIEKGAGLYWQEMLQVQRKAAETTKPPGFPEG